MELVLIQLVPHQTVPVVELVHIRVLEHHHVLNVELEHTQLVELQVALIVEQVLILRQLEEQIPQFA